MKRNGYEVGEEPTREEFAAYFKVQGYFERETAASWLDRGELTQEEFELLCHRFHKADFMDGEWDTVMYLKDKLVDARKEAA